MISKPSLTLTDVKRIAAAAEQEALANHWAVSIAIVDDGGHLLSLATRWCGAHLGAHCPGEGANRGARST
jgi:uncharacterized protein GlcG (DUF336 family)